MPFVDFKTTSIKGSELLKPINVGSTELKHRIVLAPLTRFRNNTAQEPTELMAQYYSQRSKRAGTLIISEATFISPQAGGYPLAPGIWNENQTEAWKKISSAVHENHSSIFIQLWALGRAADVDQLTKDKLPYVSASPSYYSEETKAAAIAAGNELRALTKEEIKQYVKDYVVAAKNAIAAGADGVEIHNANAYLLQQFNDPVCNQRTDEYGGSIENRARFSLEVVDALIEAVGAEKVGIRLSPFSMFLGTAGDHPLAVAQYAYLVAELEKRATEGNRLAYIHLVEPRPETLESTEVLGDNTFVSTIWKGPIIKAGNYGQRTHEAISDASDGRTLIAFGRYFISNPDLVDRLEKGETLNAYDRETFYGGGEKGYTDYPVFADVQ